MATSPKPERPIEYVLLDEIREISLTLKELLEVLNTFTNEGFPMKSQIPSSELLASMCAAVAMISRDRPLDDSELLKRVQAAQVLGAVLIRNFDQYQSVTRANALEGLLPSS